MTDLIQRLNGALPSVRAWIATTVAGYSPNATPVAALGFERLPRYFPEAVLRDTKAVTVTRIPFPPITAVGLPELATLEQMAVAGITFNDLCLVHEGLRSESVYFHELVHAVQWTALGVDGFLLTYAAGLLQYGYARSPLETMAFDLQSQFDRGHEMACVVETVRVHALQTHAATADFFRQHGVAMGA